jgi:hypothetical protein
LEHGRLILRRAPAPIEEPVTKLGGLPVWVDEPTWPVSAASGQQMLFIGQVVIEQPLFPLKTPRIAYLFITEVTEINVAQLWTFDPKSGENAVVIQDASARRQPAIVDGPCLMETYLECRIRMTRPLELAVTVCIEPIPAELSDDEHYLLQMDRRRGMEYYNALGQKVGGVPDWIQGDEMPEGWRLLLQMSEHPWVDGEALQTNLNFGRGSCYVLISPDCSEGFLLWQC